MSLRKITLLLCVFIFAGLSAQKYAYPFGEVSVAELEANKFAKDTTANAVVIAESAYRTIAQSTYSPWTRVKLPVIPSRGYAENRYYDLFPYVIETSVQRKIKVMKDAGAVYSIVEIPYYNNKAPYREEQIEGIEAWSYNLEDGKVVKTQLKKEQIINENVNDTLSQFKLRIPNVKAGSVIEYKFKRTSPLHLGIPGWELQSELPKMVSIYETLFYDAFMVNQEIKGPYPIRTHSEREQPSFTGVQQNVFSGRYAQRVLFIAQDLPAYQNVDKIWNMTDHTAGVRAELLATRYVGYVPYADKWKDVENRISVENTFDKNNYGSMFYSKELKELLKPIKDETEKIKAIYGFVKDKVKWNGKYELYADPASAVTKGSGSNAQINAILLRALYRNRIYAYPILISTRSSGRFPASFPTYDKIKTYVICAQTEDGKRYYLDGSATFGGLNMLPSVLMVENGRTFAREFMLEEDQANGNVNLTSVNSADFKGNITAKLTEEGGINGKMENTYSNLAAMHYKQEFNSSNSSQMQYEASVEKNGLKISDYTAENHLDKMSDLVNQTFSFTKKIVPNGNEIAFNPLVFTNHLLHETVEANRILPVELDTPKSFEIHSEIEIPAGYEVVSLPSSANEKLESELFDFQYSAEVKDNKVVVDYRLNMDDVVFAPADLDALRKLLNVVAEKNTAKVVLKKK